MKRVTQVITTPEHTVVQSVPAYSRDHYHAMRLIEIDPMMGHWALKHRDHVNSTRPSLT